jgi:ribosomal protein S18 acetylase RimI-like enzyme
MDNETLSVEPFGFSEEEYRQVAAIEGAVFAMPPLDWEEFQHDDETRDPDFPFRRDWILRDGQRLGYVEWSQQPGNYHPQKYDMYLMVDPACDAADIRPFCLAYLLEHFAPEDLIAITCATQENCEEGLRFFTEYGFQEVARHEISTLDLTTWDSTAFKPVLDRVSEQGIRIVALPQLQESDPAGWQQRLFELEKAISLDIPSHGEKKDETFEVWSRRRLQGPMFDADGWFVALDGDRYVAQSQGYISHSSPESFENGITGVLRDYRRRGIATALKVHLMRYAQQRGAHSVVTSNASHNPMFGLNRALGFEPEPAWIVGEKALFRDG